jgi:hypothetical protein
MTGRKIALKGYRIDRKGNLVKIPADASAAQRQRPGGSKMVKVKPASR